MWCSIFPSTNRGIDGEAQLDLQSEKRLLHFLQLHNSSMILKFVQLWKFSLPAIQAISCLLLLKLHRKLEIKMTPVVLVWSELLGYQTGCRKKQIACSFWHNLPILCICIMKQQFGHTCQHDVDQCDCREKVLHKNMVAGIACASYHEQWPKRACAIDEQMMFSQPATLAIWHPNLIFLSTIRGMDKRSRDCKRAAGNRDQDVFLLRVCSKVWLECFWSYRRTQSTTTFVHLSIMKQTIATLQASSCCWLSISKSAKAKIKLHPLVVGFLTFSSSLLTMLWELSTKHWYKRAGIVRDEWLSHTTG